MRMDDKNNSSKEDIPRILSQKAGAKTWAPVLFYIAVWYLSSLGCLLLNKTILSELGATSAQLGMCQMIGTALLGALKVWSSGGFSWSPPTPRSSSSLRTLSGGCRAPRDVDGGRGAKNGKLVSRETAARKKQLWLTIVALATLRMTSILLGLISLKHVPASFTETVKSTAPLFTVYLQHLVLGMRTSPQVLLSLVPVMAGLVVCAQAEAAFDAVGFWAAVANNVIDCLQNVVSKKTLDTVTPIHLQFYTSVLALLFQIPFILLHELTLAAVLDPRLWNPVFIAASARDAFLAATANIFHSRRTLAFYAADLGCYHAQSISAYFVVASLTPVSVSVANTLKRSLLIALSVAYFGNQMTIASVLGVLIVIAGVFLYNSARVRFPAVDQVRHQRIRPHSTEQSD